MPSLVPHIDKVRLLTEAEKQALAMLDEKIQTTCPLELLDQLEQTIEETGE